MQAHKKMVDDLLSFNINETDRVIWFDVLPNRPGSNKGPPLANSFHCWRNGLFIQIYIDTYIYIYIYSLAASIQASRIRPSLLADLPGGILNSCTLLGAGA